MASKYVQNIIGAPRGEKYIPPENPVMKCKVTFCLKETVWKKGMYIKARETVWKKSNVKNIAERFSTFRSSDFTDTAGLLIY